MATWGICQECAEHKDLILNDSRGKLCADCKKRYDDRSDKADKEMGEGYGSVPVPWQLDAQKYEGCICIAAVIFLIAAACVDWWIQ